MLLSYTGRYNGRTTENGTTQKRELETNTIIYRGKIASSTAGKVGYERTIAVYWFGEFALAPSSWLLAAREDPKIDQSTPPLGHLVDASKESRQPERKKILVDTFSVL